jgi:hypothetical protein
VAANRELLKIPIAIGKGKRSEGNEDVYEVDFAPYIETTWKKQENRFGLIDVNIPTPLIAGWTKNFRVSHLCYPILPTNTVIVIDDCFPALLVPRNVML